MTMENSDWREATNRIIADQMVSNLEKILNAEVKHYFCSDKNNKHEKIVIEYNHEKK